MAKLRVKVPAPFLVKPPAPVILAVEIVVLFAPSMVRRFPAWVIPPERVMLPDPALIVEALAKVMAPAKLAAVETLLTKAPPAEAAPVPLRVSALALTLCPLRSRVAPEVRLTVEVPNAELLPALRVPAEMVVVPE